MLSSLASIFIRDLDKVSKELKLYNSEDNLWKTSPEISNSAGNLALHLCGNLNHFIGAILGKTGYVRDRLAEFTSKNIPIKNIVAEIENTKKVITDSLEPLSSSDLAKQYPIDVFGHSMTTEYFLIHLLSHLNYHLGQINYHRRLVG